MLFSKKQKASPAAAKEPGAVSPHASGHVLGRGAIVALLDAGGERLGDGVVARMEPDGEGYLVSLIRKPGEIVLPAFSEGDAIKGYGCDRNLSFVLSGTVAVSTKTDLAVAGAEVSEMPNRRSVFRVPMEGDADVYVPEEGQKPRKVTMGIEDISTAGMRLIGSAGQPVLEPGVIVHIEAVLKGRDRNWKLDTDAEVLRGDARPGKYGKQVYVYGILFPQFADKELAKFSQWLNMYQAYTRRKA